MQFLLVNFGPTTGQFKEAFGVDIAAIFDHFDPTPIASGAIAQVYRAHLASPIHGIQQVAVKVRHPGVEEQIARDIRILNMLVSVVNHPHCLPALL